MTFGQPEALIWMWSLGLALLLVWASGVLRRRRLRKVGAYWQRLILAAPGVWALRAKAGFWILALALLLLALARPRWGFEWRDTKSKGADIFIAIDLSTSMLAEDVKPNRLERAKREVQDFFQMLQGDRVALIGFAGNAFLQCPLTVDYGAAEMFLNILEPKLVGVQGTAIGEAVKVALTSIKDQVVSASQNTALIIITDGEDHDEETRKILEDAAKNGMRVYVLGVGTEAGAPIPEPGGGFKQDRQGNVIVSKLRPDVLRAIASDGGGIYTPSVVDDGDWRRIYEQRIRKDLEEQELDQGRQKVFIERSGWLVMMAMMILFFQMLMRARGQVIVWLLVGGLWSVNGEVKAQSKSAAEQSFKKGDFRKARKLYEKIAKKNPNDLQSVYNAAVSAYKEGDYAAASKGFAKAAESKDKHLSAQAYYNLGNSEVKNNNVDGAVAAYEEALKLAPDYQKAQENLAYVRQQQNPPPPQQQQQQSGEPPKNASPQPGQAQNAPPTPQGHEQNQGEPQPGERQEDAQSKENQQPTPGEQKPEEQKAEQSQESKAGEESASEETDRPNQMSKEEAAKLLNSAKDRSEKYLNRGLRKNQNSRDEQGRQEKDW